MAQFDEDNLVLIAVISIGKGANLVEDDNVSTRVNLISGKIAEMIGKLNVKPKNFLDFISLLTLHTIPPNDQLNPQGTWATGLGVPSLEDFEGKPGVTPEIVEWFKKGTITLATGHPNFDIKKEMNKLKDALPPEILKQFEDEQKAKKARGEGRDRESGEKF
tara:strand:- start:17119 stop:17604 length:486 start_codon:yes stop_codon:yes gene_type:complete